MPDLKPKMYVFAAAFQGGPALIVHTEDGLMEQDHWDALLTRLNRIARGVEPNHLWTDLDVADLVWADESSHTEFRMAMQYPLGLTAEDAIARLTSFAPEFEWVVQARDTSQRTALPKSGTIQVSWTEIAPSDDDPLTRFAWSMKVSPHMDEEVVTVALETAAENIYELLEG